MYNAVSCVSGSMCIDYCVDDDEGNPESKLENGECEVVRKKN